MWAAQPIKGALEQGGRAEDLGEEGMGAAQPIKGSPRAGPAARMPFETPPFALEGVEC